MYRYQKSVREEDMKLFEAIAALILVSSPAWAGEKSLDDINLEVDICLKDVHEQYPYGDFNAYWDPTAKTLRTNKDNVVGGQTESLRFALKKCLVGLGC